MSKNHFVCANHFRHVVTTSAGNPTCRECGLAPTSAELQNVERLIDWDKARLRANVTSSNLAGRRRR